MSRSLRDVPVLTVTTGDRAGRRYALAGADVLVGRGLDAVLRLDSPGVEDRHAVLRRRGDTLEVEDLGSAEGTWVNGQQVQGRATVRSGDVLRVADVVLRVGTGTVPTPSLTPSDVPAPPHAPTAAPPRPRVSPAIPAPRRRPGTPRESPTGGAGDLGDEVQGRGPGLLLLALGSALAFVGVVLWAWLLLTSGDDVRAATALPAESPLTRTVAGIPAVPVAFAFLMGGGALALIGAAWLRPQWVSAVARARH